MKALIVNYGVGNFFSIECALKKTGLDARIVVSPEELDGADGIVLPGVGNFGVASENLEPFKSTIAKLVAKGVPLLGVCLGMQLLFEESEEGLGKGLGLIRGKVVRLPRQVKTPHMGWNTLKLHRSERLLEGINEKDYFYFVHSYYPKPLNESVVAAETSYGVDFASVLDTGNIYATQFHPEKSGKAGMRILANFSDLIARR